MLDVDALPTLPTPAIVVDLDVLEANQAACTAVLPGARLRPHIKAHKTTGLAHLQAAAGHRSFTCATPREVLGMARVGLGHDLLLANECLDPDRLAALATANRGPARITIAVDSEATIEAAAAAGLREVLIDVNVGLPRCGCAPDDAGRLADLARRRGLEVRGVMGYEGHVMPEPERTRRVELVAECVAKLLHAHEQVGGDVISGGGTGTWDLHDHATEVQAGSYLLMDTCYARLDLPFRQALYVLATVVSTTAPWAVCDAGLKSLGMDHGDPTIEGSKIWFCSDEHITFAPAGRVLPAVGSRVLVTPAHVDPTMAMHEQVHLIRGNEVVDTLPIDLRGW